MAPTETLGYNYDLGSNLITVTDAGGTTGYHYDIRNEVDQVSEFSGRYTVFAYDNDGRRTDTWTNSGPVQYSGNNVIRRPVSPPTPIRPTPTRVGRRR